MGGMPEPKEMGVILNHKDNQIDVVRMEIDRLRLERDELQQQYELAQQREVGYIESIADRDMLWGIAALTAGKEALADENERLETSLDAAGQRSQDLTTTQGQLRERRGAADNARIAVDAALTSIEGERRSGIPDL